MDSNRRSVYLARNFLPLTVVWRPGIVAFASERSFFADSDSPFPPYRIWELPAYSAIEFSPNGYRDPVRWGDLPDGASAETWKPYPEF